MADYVTISYHKGKARITSEEGAEHIMYNPSGMAVPDLLCRKFKMAKADAMYANSEAIRYGGFKFSTNERFVYGDLESIQRSLNEYGKAMSKELPPATFGVFYHLDGRLRRYKDYTGTAALARSMRKQAKQDMPRAALVIVKFNSGKYEVL